MKNILLVVLAVVAVGCATLTEDAMTPVALSFSDGTAGTCQLTNKRGAWAVDIPSVASIRKSDDALKYQCETKDGRNAVGSIESEMGAKIVASAVFIDLGITDAITDKHRKYAESYVIPVVPREGVDGMAGGNEGAQSPANSVSSELRELEELRKEGVITDEEFETQKKKVLDGN